MAVPAKKQNTVAIQPRLRVFFREDVALGPGKAELLATIALTGSLSEAARRMGMSYMRAWKLVKLMNECFAEPLVLTTRGGRKKGGAQLTPTGLQALELYQQMEQDSQRATARYQKAFQKLLRER